MSNSLYEEAIADAKQLKEAAERNAKNAIIEAVTPKIKQFIDQQLIGDYQEDDTDVLGSVIGESFSHSDDSDVVLSDDAVSSLLSLFTGESLDESLKKVKSRSVVVHALKESLDLMNGSDREKILKIADKLKLEADNFGSDDIVMEEDNILNILEENQNMSRHDDEILYDVDLDALVNNLTESLDEDTHWGGGADEYKRVGGHKTGVVGGHYTDYPEQERMREDSEEEDPDDDGSGVDEIDLAELDLILTGLPDELRDQIDLSQLAIEFSEDEEGEELDVDIDIDMEEEPEEGEEGEEFEEEEVETEEEGLAEVFEVDVDVLYDELRRMNEARGLVDMKGIKNDMSDQWGGSGSSKAGVKGAYGGTGTGKAGVVGAFGGGKASGDPLKVKLNKLSEALKKEGRKNRALKNRLNEYVSAINSLREQLTEMNLFNAKLLYVNKLLQDKGASSSQKRAIIEAIDGARSLREVKLLFKSLTQSITKEKTGRTLSESAVRRSLGSSSRTVSRSTPVRSETHEMARWARLAGIE